MLPSDDVPFPLYTLYRSGSTRLTTIHGNRLVILFVDEQQNGQPDELRCRSCRFVVGLSEKRRNG